MNIGNQQGSSIHNGLYSQKKYKDQPMFSKKKKNSFSQSEAIVIEPTYGNKKDITNEKDNYGDEDNSGLLINQAGKVGKAQHNFFRESEKKEEVQSARSISAQELAQHKSIQSAWLSLNGTVYDVTNYIKYHPGGRLILQGCGQQCSQLFNKYHAWVNGEFLLKKYKLGYLVDK